MDSYEGQEEIVSALREILQICKYRASLQNLLSPSDPTTAKGTTSLTVIHFVVVTEDGDSFSEIYKDAEAAFYTSSRTIITQASDQDIAEKLLMFMQRYGRKTDS